MEAVNIKTMKQNAAEVSEILRIMAHPERLMVLCQLTKGEVGVGVLQQGSSLSQSAFSQHLTVLRKHGLIKARKESQQVFYSLADNRVTQLIQSLQMTFCG
ncbi:helix-turn-helix transcriptional regulator [Vibrio sp. Y2-5]|uniref:ArsR/SmtB family transcription factor n=1 Tax=Vibrio TaxID=662 RepID=UPI00142E53A3|nr:MULTISPECIES: metalloregulator ArsR/SmtB family transcription factor [Vibrio]MBD0788337.1 helix-turn-helix transcriptional regulator [Vibrio sp. Y2-5]NIY92015.1 helix-turn-helix transcriptional regulator [Vibrio diazotrophicus]